MFITFLYASPFDVVARASSSNLEYLIASVARFAKKIQLHLCHVV